MATRQWARICGAGVVAALLCFEAAAQETSNGIVVRLETGGKSFSEPVVAVLTPKGGGKAVEAVLNDSGTLPDVKAGDQSWSGAAFIADDTVSVVLKAGQDVHDGGTVSWTADDRFRELAVRFSDGVMTIDASVAAAGAGPGSDATATGLPPLGDEAGGGSASTVADGATPSTGGSNTMGARPSAVSFPKESALKPELFIGLGVGLLLLVGMAWLAMRNRRSESSPQASGLVPLPEPALVGAHTPSLSDGLSLWVADEATTTELLGPLLATLAREHRVLLVGPTALQPPPVRGGPVYRVTSARPSLAGDAADALLREAATPLAVLFLAKVVDGNTLRDYADVLPPGVGGLVLSSNDPDVPWRKVQVTREGALFVLTTTSGQDRVSARERGLEVDL